MDNVELAFQSFGERGSPLTILHGLFGSGRNWNAIARRLSEQARVLVPDLRNHGASPHFEPMTYPAMTSDALALLDQQRLQRVDMIGHSMGGKAAMWLALTEPDRVNRLVVVDVAPVEYGHHFRDIIRPLRGLPLDRMTGRADVDDWLAQHIPEPALRQFLLQNLIWRNNRYRWRINLDGIERALPDLMAFPKTDRVRPFLGSVLFVVGACSNYVLPEHTAVIRRLFPTARIERLPDAGHWLHSEQPEAFLSRVEPFLR